jgi:translation initiation factor 4E
MKQVLDLNETTRLGYMLHDDAIKLDRKAKDRYTV